jgi:hypothetical protein
MYPKSVGPGGGLSHRRKKKSSGARLCAWCATVKGLRVPIRARAAHAALGSGIRVRVWEWKGKRNDRHAKSRIVIFRRICHSREGEAWVRASRTCPTVSQIRGYLYGSREVSIPSVRGFVTGYVYLQRKETRDLSPLARWGWHTLHMESSAQPLSPCTDYKRAKSPSSLFTRTWFCSVANPPPRGTGECKTCVRIQDISMISPGNRGFLDP